MIRAGGNCLSSSGLSFFSRCVHFPEAVAKGNFRCGFFGSIDEGGCLLFPMGKSQEDLHSGVFACFSSGIDELDFSPEFFRFRYEFGFPLQKRRV